MEQIIEFVTDNWLLTIGVAALIGYAVWDFIKRKKNQKRKKEAAAEIERSIRRERLNEMERREQKETQNYSEPEPRIKTENNSLSNYFAEKKEVSKETNLNLKDFSIQVFNEKGELEKQIKNQNDEMKKELSEVIKKKDEIKKQGMALAALFDKYREREEQLKKILEQK